MGIDRTQLVTGRCKHNLLKTSSLGAMFGIVKNVLYLCFRSFPRQVVGDFSINHKSIIMEEVFISYKTDTWHSYASRDLIGASADLQGAIALCRMEAEKEGESFDSDQEYNINNIKQTQGYSGEGEFYIDQINLDELI
jgi:hypothetical protein